MGIELRLKNMRFLYCTNSTKSRKVSYFIFVLAVILLSIRYKYYTLECWLQRLKSSSASFSYLCCKRRTIKLFCNKILLKTLCLVYKRVKHICELEFLFIETYFM